MEKTEIGRQTAPAEQFIRGVNRFLWAKEDAKLGKLLQMAAWGKRVPDEQGKIVGFRQVFLIFRNEVILSCENSSFNHRLAIPMRRK